MTFREFVDAALRIDPTAHHFSVDYNINHDRPDHVWMNWCVQSRRNGICAMEPTAERALDALRLEATEHDKHPVDLEAVGEPA